MKNQENKLIIKTMGVASRNTQLRESHKLGSWGEARVMGSS